MGYWTQRDFVDPIIEHQKLSDAPKDGVIAEANGQRKRILTNLAGMIPHGGTWHSVQKWPSDMEYQIKSIDWKGLTPYYFERFCFLINSWIKYGNGKRDYLKYVVPPKSEKGEYSINVIKTMLELGDSDLQIEWFGGAVNGSMTVTEPSGKQTSCYVNFRYNELSFNREDQAEVLKVLKTKGGVLLEKYIK